ncbi:MAG: histidine ammonia-lyase [Bacteroidetes bacterium]|nr:histidine ammonia-lyase [Rhodothermia bacterium]MCS7155352.1 histidine ammonia-lyase [Bacteroidota bacterium]MCX7907555.1 histidine ammonia-lyase [Bacteroidota bacterium]MDW8138549.1 histidine ammonia-lyase [Bacteroidota bacterium]MDW8284514.1 histidine ammonia-lyase [Bacteroidota bacterium]
MVILEGGDLTIARIAELLARREPIGLSPVAWERVHRAWRWIELAAQEEVPVYGVNTGFGALAQERIPVQARSQLQRNLLLSHAVGVGEPLPDEVVRLMLLLKINSLALGYSGVRPQTLERLIALYNADLLPWVPSRGSLGASGDLAPLAHLVLPLIGEGELKEGGRLRPARAVLLERGWAPLELGPKEGLALINGTQLMSACGTWVLLRARRLLPTADLILSMSLEALQGSLRPFDARLHAVRPHPGAAIVAENVRRLLQESEILASHRLCDKVQDPYSLRCAPQVHGASRDALAYLERVVETEINAATDNPLVFEDGTILSGGNFHGQPLALALDLAAIALAELASISERRLYLLLEGRDGLPRLLVRNTGLNSGLMLLQYTAAALVSENKVLCHPASVDSIPTSLGQEDHVSMGSIAALKLLQVLENTETVLALELLAAAQALDYRLPLMPGRGVRLAHEIVRQHIPHAEADHLLSPSIAQALELVRSGVLLEAEPALL